MNPKRFPQSPPKHGGRQEIICRCNNISRETIENAIRNGAKTLNEIYDSTTAGVGPCGGSCRRKIKPILDVYLESGQFPNRPVPPKKSS